MSINVGELQVSLGLDPKQFDQGLKALPQESEKYGKKAGEGLAAGVEKGASGVRLSADSLYSSRADFDKAGAALGQSTSDGITRGADGRLRDSKGRFLAAGQELGGAVGDGLGEGTSGMGDSLSGAMSMAGPPMVAAALAVAALAGAALVKGLTDAMDIEVANDKLAAQLGANEEQSAAMGKVAGNLYANAYGESMGEVNEAVGAVASTFGDHIGPNVDMLEMLSAAAMNFATAFDVDVNRAVSSAGILMKSGLAKDAGEAFDLMTAASQKVPAHLREDVLDASDEYSQFFASLGINGQEAMGLLVSASEDGMYGIDKMGDALKELTIRSTDMSTASVDAYKAAGLNAEDMAAKFLAGGETARGALSELVTGLQGIEDPVKRSNAAIGLFGTPLEDLSVSEIPAFLEQLNGVNAGLGNVEGTAAKMGDTLSNNAATKIESFKRKGLQALTDFMGGTVIPMIERFVNSKGFQEWLVDMRGHAEAVVAWFQRNWPLISDVITTAAGHIMTVLDAWWKYTQAGIDVYLWLFDNVLKPFAEWVAGTLVPTIASIAEKIGAVLVPVVQWLADLWTGTLWPALQVVATFIMGTVIPVLGAIASKMGDVASWVAARIGDIVGFVVSIPGRIVGVVSTMWNGISDGIGAAKNWVADRIGDIVGLVTGIPGRIGSLADSLKGAGGDLVQGLIDGITGMAGKAVEKIKGLAGDLVGAVKDKLAIFSPSKVFVELGSYVTEGLAVGIEQQQQSAIRSISKVAAALAPAASAQLGSIGAPGSSLSVAAAGSPTHNGNVDRSTNVNLSGYRLSPGQLAQRIAFEQKTAGV